MITGDNLTGSGITVNPGAKNILITNNIISNILLPGGGNAFTTFLWNLMLG